MAQKGNLVMISNERPSPYGDRKYSSQGKPNSPEATLFSEKIQVERKAFLFALKENMRGRFLRITEDVNGRRDTIIIPATGLHDFKKVLEDICATSDGTPPQLQDNESETS